MPAPPTALTGQFTTAGTEWSWTASPDAQLGYHVSTVSAIGGPSTRITSDPVTGTAFTAPAAGLDPATRFMVRAVRAGRAPSPTWVESLLGLLRVARRSKN